MNMLGEVDSNLNKRKILSNQNFCFRIKSVPLQECKTERSSRGPSSSKSISLSKRKYEKQVKNVPTTDDYEMGILQKMNRINRETFRVISRTKIKLCRSQDSYFRRAIKNHERKQTPEKRVVEDSKKVQKQKIKRLKQLNSKYKNLCKQAKKQIAKIKRQRKQKKRLAEVEKNIYLVIISNLKRQFDRPSIIKKSTSLDSTQIQSYSEFPNNY